MLNNFRLVVFTLIREFNTIRENHDDFHVFFLSFFFEFVALPPTNVSVLSTELFFPLLPVVYHFINAKDNLIYYCSLHTNEFDSAFCIKEVNDTLNVLKTQIVLANKGISVHGILDGV